MRRKSMSKEVVELVMEAATGALAMIAVYGVYVAAIAHF